MRQQIKSLLVKVANKLDDYNPLLEQDRKRLLDEYGNFLDMYNKADDILNYDDVDENEEKALKDIKQQIGYTLSFIQAEYKARVSLDIIRMLDLWKNDDGGFFYALPDYQRAMLIEALILAGEVIPYDYKEKEGK